MKFTKREKTFFKVMLSLAALLLVTEFFDPQLAMHHFGERAVKKPAECLLPCVGYPNALLVGQAALRY